MSDSVYLTLDEGRAMIARAVDRAKELRQLSAFAVVDAGGNVVSIARMDDAPDASIEVARAKAYVAAVVGCPTEAFAADARARPESFAALQSLLPKGPFPGPGGMPVVKHGRVVGGIGAGGIGPYTSIPGLDASKLTFGGIRANAEDLIICAALGIPDQSQQGDEFLADPGSVDPMPAGDLPLGLAEAWRYADRAIDQARASGLNVGVAIVDEMGRLIQADRMDNAPLVSAEMAAAKALSAVKFQRPTSALTDEFRGRSARMRAIERIGHFTILAMGGGVPIARNGRVVGAIGVSGSGAQGSAGGDEPIALAAISTSD